MESARQEQEFLQHDSTCVTVFDAISVLLSSSFFFLSNIA
jgi:hypothetical protein